MQIFKDGDTKKLVQPELEAELYYLTEQEGGRKTAVGNGYRGQFYYNGRNWNAPQQFIDKDLCNPGETIKVYLQTLSPEFHVGQFYIGKEFETREGAKTVGKGIITKILRPDFNYRRFYFSEIN
ncbi:MAG: elongation factor Tu [Pedobacter sp.]|nr:MAG: elongation factor Tu [Pedobacter sp.]